MTEVLVPVTFVFDEQMRSRKLRHALVKHALIGGWPINFVRVGDPGVAPYGTPDPDVLIWAADHGRVLVSEDKKTMRTHFADHLAAGRHSAGVMLVRPSATNDDLIQYLEMVGVACRPDEFHDRILFVPEW